MMHIFFLTLWLLSMVPAFSQDNFFPFAIDQDGLRGAPDFSFLNHPLQPADQLFVRDGHFYRVGADLRANSNDDERVRLFGVNLAFGANFPTAGDAARIAKRLRRLGVNLVRLHHMDSQPDRDPNTANSLLTTDPYPTPNPVAITRLRAFLNALKAEGIYVDLNLHVGYQFRPSVDQVPSLPNNIPMPPQTKPLHIFFPRMVKLQAEFAQKVIKALALKDDPVLAMVEINNESSLLQAWQTGSLDRYLLGDYKTELQRQWNSFLKRRYASTHALRAAWGSDEPDRRGLAEGETLETASVSLVGGNETAIQERANDYLLFLADRDRLYWSAILRAVREVASPLAPVAGTQMGYGGLLNLDSGAELAYQDNHFYVDHYNFPHAPWDGLDWRIRDTSSVGSGLGAFQNMAAAREAGRPYTVSEFNQPWPNSHGAEIDATLAAFAAFQDWDAIVHLAYSHGRNWNDGVPNGFNINGDWTKFPNLGQAAWLFRSGAIHVGTKPIEILVSKDLRLRAGREKRNGNISGFLAEAIGYDPAIAFVHPVRLVKGEDRSLSGTGAAPRGPYYSDTGEITYDRDRKLFLIHASVAAGVFGFVGRGKATAGPLDVELAPTARGFASILLATLDQQPLEKSGHLLLSTPGTTLRSQPGSDPPRPQALVNYPGTTDWWTLEPDPGFPNKPSGNLNGGIRPVWMERVGSYVTFRTAAARLIVYPLDGAGARLTPLSEADVERLDGGFTIHLRASGQRFSPWYELVVRRKEDF